MSKTVNDIIQMKSKEKMSIWLEKGEESIMSGDINAEVNGPNIGNFFNEFKSTERLTESHEICPETCKRNSQGKMIDGTWTTPGSNPVSCGHTPFEDEWDHGML